MLLNDIHNGFMCWNYYSKRKKLILTEKRKKRLKNTGYYEDKK